MLICTNKSHWHSQIWRERNFIFFGLRAALWVNGKLNIECWSFFKKNKLVSVASESLFMLLQAPKNQKHKGIALSWEVGDLKGILGIKCLF